MLPIRIRLTFWYVAIFSITLIIYSVFLFAFISHKVMKNTDADILAEARECKSIFLEEVTKPSFEELDEELKGINYYLQIYSINGNLLYSSANLYNTNIPVDTGSYNAIEHEKFVFQDIRLFKHTKVRVLLYPIITEGIVKYYMCLGMPLNEIEGFLNMLKLILTIVTPIFIIVTSWGGIVIAGKAMKPVDDIINAARRIEAGNLAEQIRIKTKNDEIGKLAETFNEMLQRLNKTFNALTNFSQNVSHELKTSLTIMKSGIEINIKEEKSASDYKELLISLLEEINQMARVIDDLLLTSLSDVRSIKASFTQINISTLLMETIDFLSVLAQDKGVLFDHNIQDGITMIGNERLLKRAFSNLIDNAIKFTPKGKRVFTSAVRQDSKIIINITDQGIGIPEEDISKIFDRFYRSKTSNAKGHGLGLSIAKWIIELHQGKVDITSSAQGTNFQITFTS